ncbi:hypothetical protein HDV00_004270, partial [Rhizophlyctis rosea]
MPPKRKAKVIPSTEDLNLSTVPNLKLFAHQGSAQTKQPKAAKTAPNATASETSAQRQIQRVLEVRNNRRAQECLITYTDGSAPEWVPLERVPEDLVEAHQKEEDEKIVEAIIGQKVVRGKVYFQVRYIGSGQEEWIPGTSPRLSDEQIEEYEVSHLEITAILAERPKTSSITNELEYFIQRKRTQTMISKKTVADKAWVSRDVIPEDLLAKHDEKMAAIRDERKQLDERRKLVNAWTAQHVPVAREILTTCCQDCTIRSLGYAVDNNDLIMVKKIAEQLGVQKQQPSALFASTARLNNLEMFKILQSTFPTTPLTTIQTLSAPYTLSAEYIDIILGPSTNSAYNGFLSSFAVQTLKHGQVQNAVHCFGIMMQPKVPGGPSRSLSVMPPVSSSGHVNVLPKDGPFTRLHWQALTAQTVADITEPLEEETINAGALGIYLTPVHCASINPNVEVLKLLIEKGGDLTLSDESGRLPVHFAAYTGPSETMMDVDGEDPPSPTLLYLLELESEDRALSAKVHNIKYVTDRWNHSTTHEPPIIKALDAGRDANVKALHNHMKLLAMDEPAHTHANWLRPLVKKAIECNKWQYLHEFLEPTSVTSFDWWSTLSLCITKGCPEAFIILFNEMSETSRTQVQTHATHLLSQSVDNDHLEIVRILLGQLDDELGSCWDPALVANLNALSGKTLMSAVQHGRRDLAKVLIEGGIGVQFVDERGCTVLMCAARNGHRKCVELLVESGVDVNNRFDDQ